MGLLNGVDEQDKAQKAGSSNLKAKERFFGRLRRCLGKKGEQARQIDTGTVSSTRGSHDAQNDDPRVGDVVASPGNFPLTTSRDLSMEQPLWDRAYATLREDKAMLVQKYEELLSKEVQMATSTTPTTEPFVLATLPNDVTISANAQSRQAQLDTIIAQGLDRMEKKNKYVIAGHEFVAREQVAKAAGLVLWAKDWIGAAVKASPEASIAWAGICVVLPLLTNAKTAEEANRDGFTYVTTRMRYYAALEPLLQRLGRVAGVSDALLQEAIGHVVILYQHILEFQIRSVLRFYQSSFGGYVRDAIMPDDWKQMRVDIEKLESTVNSDFSQINEFASRQELEALDNTSKESLNVMQLHLAVSEQQLRLIEDHRDIAQRQLEIQEDVVKQQLSKEQKECLQLFRLTASEKDITYEWYKECVEDRVQDTCLWFLDHPKFQQWLDQESGSLLVSADPGCVKSVLAKYLIDSALPRSAAICYFFFKDGDQNTTRQALCAILHQLLSQRPSLIEHAMKKAAVDGPGLVNSTSSLWTILEDAVQDRRTGSVIIVLDALDECDEAEFRNLMWHVDDLFRSDASGHGKLKYLLTSRPYEQITSNFRSLSEAFSHSIRIPGEEESETISQEINHVIEYRVEQLALEKRIPARVKTALSNRLLGIQHRTYLWVYLVFEHLKMEDFKKTEKGVESVLATLPSTVGQAYERILSRSKDHHMVRKVLSIILAATRPLTVSEMNIAVNLEYASQSFANLDLEEEEDFKTRLRSWCGLFVSVYHGRVHFLHQTAREFLLADIASQATISSELRWHGSITATQAHTILTELCIIYLDLFNSEVSLPSYNKDDTDRYIANRGFLHYAAGAWVTHFRQSDIADDATILRLAASICNQHSRSYDTWFKPYCSKPRHEDMMMRKPWWPSPTSKLALPSYFGLDALVKFLIREGADVEERDDYELRALEWAILCGRMTTVHILLDEGTDVVLTNDNNWMPLHWALQAGNESIVRLLLDKGADIEAEAYSETPLSQAAASGHEAIVRLLLDKGAEIEANGSSGTALLRAATSGHEAIVRLLLDKGADIEAKICSGTALIQAAAHGFEVIVQVLLDKGADIEAKEHRDLTPLLWAAFHGHKNIVQLLLKKGANIEAKDYRNRTPLLWAACRGCEDVVQLLLEKGANIEAKDYWNLTPLLWAACRGCEDVVQLLLERGANIEARDPDGETPLLLAARKGYEAVVQLLLERGASIEAKTNSGETALHAVDWRSGYGIAKILLERGVDVDAEDDRGCTALSKAMESGSHPGFVRLLLQEGANIKAKGLSSLTTWLRTNISRNPEDTTLAVQLLIERGADMDEKYDDGHTLLCEAAWSRALSLVQFLIDRGADLGERSADDWVKLAVARKERDPYRHLSR